MYNKQVWSMVMRKIHLMLSLLFTFEKFSFFTFQENAIFDLIRSFQRQRRVYSRIDNMFLEAPLNYFKGLIT